jgi:hypothetical protein
MRVRIGPQYTLFMVRDDNAGETANTEVSCHNMCFKDI